MIGFLSLPSWGCPIRVQSFSDSKWKGFLLTIESAFDIDLALKHLKIVCWIKWETICSPKETVYVDTTCLLFLSDMATSFSKFYEETQKGFCGIKFLLN